MIAYGLVNIILSNVVYKYYRFLHVREYACDEPTTSARYRSAKFDVSLCHIAIDQNAL